MALISTFFFVLEILLSMTTSAATEIPIWWGGGGGGGGNNTTIALEIPSKVDLILSEKYPVYKYFTTRGKLEHLKLFLL